MKKIYLTLGAITVLSCTILLFAQAEPKMEIMEKTKATVSTQSQTNKKVLVAYFTWPEPDGVDASSGASRVIADDQLYGNTEYVARLIGKATEGDLFAIKTERTYPTPHKALIDDAKKEAEANERPKLTTHITNLADYDVIFVGYPNWWYDIPMAIYTFFDEYDFSGKTIIPFVTHGGSSFSQSVETIAKMEKGAKIIKGPSIPARSVPNSKSSIVNWLQQQGLINK